MPQFDPNVWPTQLFWLAVIFVVLVILMKKIALPPITSILEEREVRIDNQLRKAENLKKDAEEAAAAYEKTIADARADAQALVQKVRNDAQAEATQRNRVLTERLQAELDAAEKRIAEAREKAIAALQDVASDLVGSITTRLVGETFDSTAVSNAVSKVVKEGA